LNIESDPPLGRGFRPFDSRPGLMYI